jgi:hypothetical protein
VFHGVDGQESLQEAVLAGMWLGDLAWERLAARLDRPSP